MGMGIMTQSGREGLLLQFMSAMEAHFPPREVPRRLLEQEQQPDDKKRGLCMM